MDYQSRIIYRPEHPTTDFFTVKPGQAFPSLTN